MVEIAVQTVWGADPADISLLFALWYMRSGGGFDSLLDTEGGAQQDRFDGGSQLISLRLAAELGDRVLTGCSGDRGSRTPVASACGSRPARPGVSARARDLRDGPAACVTGSSGSRGCRPRARSWASGCHGART